MSLRKAINNKSRECTHDPLGAGSAAQEIACCTDANCILHAVRPITPTTISKSLPDALHITPEQLSGRAQELPRSNPLVSGDGQIDLFLSKEQIYGRTPT